MKQYITLWRQVLAQAMYDSIKENDDGYFKLDNPDFLDVCDMAHLDATGVVERFFMLKNKLIKC